MKLSTTSLRLVLATGLAMGVLPQAFAAGTTAGEIISSTATVDYEVGGVNQTDVNSNTSTFVVDRVVIVTVAEVGGAATEVVPGDIAQVTAFTVTNNSNSILDFRLSGSNAAGDDFDISGLVVRVESGATAGYQAAEDSATFIDELAADQQRTVYIVGGIPASAANGDLANVVLTAVAAETTDADGAHVATAGTLAADAVETNVGAADDPDYIDTVFGDIAGATDAARDGAHSDNDQYEVVTASIAVNKSSYVVTDPFNCTTDGDPSSCTSAPKAIPGAVVEYCLDVHNTGDATANSIVLTDSIPANTTYVTDSITINATGTNEACDVGSGDPETDVAADDDADFNPATGTDGAVTIRSTSITAASRFKATFRVTVD